MTISEGPSRTAAGMDRRANFRSAGVSLKRVITVQPASPRRASWPLAAPISPPPSQARQGPRQGSTPVQPVVAVAAAYLGGAGRAVDAPAACGRRRAAGGALPPAGGAGRTSAGSHGSPPSPFRPARAAPGSRRRSGRAEKPRAGRGAPLRRAVPRAAARRRDAPTASRRRRRPASAAGLRARGAAQQLNRLMCAFLQIVL